MHCTLLTLWLHFWKRVDPKDITEHSECHAPQPDGSIVPGSGELETLSVAGRPGSSEFSGFYRPSSHCLTDSPGILGSFWGLPGGSEKLSSLSQVHSREGWSQGLHLPEERKHLFLAS